MNNKQVPRSWEIVSLFCKFVRDWRLSMTSMAERDIVDFCEECGFIFVDRKNKEFVAE